MTLIPVFAFHENIPALDTEKEIKKYYTEHITNDPDFQSTVRQQEEAASKEILGCTLSSAAGRLLQVVNLLKVKWQNVTNIWLILQAACKNHYDVYEFCSKALSKYITDRELNGKVVDALVLSNFGKNIDANLNSNEGNEHSNTSLPEVESMNEYFGGLPISSLKQKFSNSS